MDGEAIGELLRVLKGRQTSLSRPESYEDGNCTQGLQNDETALIFIALGQQEYGGRDAVQRVRQLCMQFLNRLALWCGCVCLHEQNHSGFIQPKRAQDLLDCVSVLGCSDIFCPQSEQKTLSPKFFEVEILLRG